MVATILAVTALIPVGAASMITGDFSQMVYKPKRRTVHLFLKHRFWIIGASFDLWLAAVVLHFVLDDTSVVLLVVTGLFVALFTLLGYGMSPYVIFPSLRKPEWISADEADSVIRDDDDVIGVEIKGDARAYPVDWSFRPHLIQETIGGESVVMSYCLLSNLGVTFRAEMDGTSMNCIMPIQWENNMVIYDTSGDRLIQQIDGSVLHGEGVGQPLETYPTLIMSWAAWRRLHPDTTVLHNPPAGLWDRFVRRFIGTKFLEENRRREGPMFPTIDSIDDRLPSKAEVVGVEAGGIQRAYPVEQLVAARVVNDDVGGLPMVVAALDGVVAVFERTVGGDVLVFSAADGALVDGTGTTWDMTGRATGGQNEGSQLVPYPHHNRILWFIWSNFNPATEVFEVAS